MCCLENSWLIFYGQRLRKDAFCLHNCVVTAFTSRGCLNHAANQPNLDLLKPPIKWFGLYFLAFCPTDCSLGFLHTWQCPQLSSPISVLRVEHQLFSGCFVDGQRTPAQALFIFLHKHPSNVFMIGKAEHMSKHLLKSHLPFDLCINNLILSFPPFFFWRTFFSSHNHIPRHNPISVFPKKSCHSSTTCFEFTVPR